MPDKDQVSEFVTLLMRSEREIYGYIRSLIPNRADAEDVLQETSQILWEKNDSFEPGTNFVAWALTIARYEVLSFYRRSRRDRLRFSDALIETLADDAQNSPEQFSSMSDALEHCLRLLKPRDRRLLADRYESSASVQDIALQLKSPVQTTYSRLKRIRRALFQCIQRQLASEGRV